MDGKSEVAGLRALLAKWRSDAEAVERASTAQYLDASRVAKASRKKLEFAAMLALSALLDRLEAQDKRIEVLSAGLVAIKVQEEHEIALDPDWPRRIAAAALRSTDHD